jgi:hypothetical protein
LLASPASLSPDSPFGQCPYILDAPHPVLVGDPRWGCQRGSGIWGEAWGDSQVKSQPQPLPPALDCALLLLFVSRAQLISFSPSLPSHPDSTLSPLSLHVAPEGSISARGPPLLTVLYGS